MVFTGNGSDAWGVYNISTGQYSRPSSTGDNEIQSKDGGLVYDPVSDKMVAWQGGASVYTLDLDTWVWTRVSPATSNTVTPTAGNSNGTFGRFRYVPSRNVFIGVNAVDENVYIYRLTAGTGITSHLKKSINQSHQITATPNPFQSAVSFQLSAISGEDTRLAIYNVMGKLVKSFDKIKSNRLEWRADGFSKGIYILKVKTGGQVISKPLFLQ
jgi:hypothetical protein